MRLASIAVLGFGLFACSAGQLNEKQLTYKVQPGITEGSLTVYPVTASLVFDTSQFQTLDEGIRSGQVSVEEMGQSTGLVRPRPSDGGVWRERPVPLPQPVEGPRVNQLALVNHSDPPLLLLAGEIVTGGKQDRVVGKDRIVPAHSDPVPLDVFCVEPGRWIGASAQFGATASSMAQPSVRSKAMAERNQQEVWNEVAKSRSSIAGAVTAAAPMVQSSSSYAAALQNGIVSEKLDSIAVPIERSYEKLMQQLRAEKATGAVVAVNGEIIWADVFASPALLEKYWPKLVRSYAAESLGPHPLHSASPGKPSQERAQDFMDHLYGNHENVETEPGVYRNSEFQAEDFDVFVLTSLLPKTGYQVHLAKIKL